MIHVLHVGKGIIITLIDKYNIGEYNLKKCS